MALTKTCLRAQAKKGAELLDHKHPGWWRKVKTTELDMSECDRCVLGWVFEGSSDNDLGYWSGVWGLFGSGDFRSPWTHGFNAEGKAFKDGTTDFDVLADEWVKRIQQRRREYRADLAQRHDQRSVTVGSIT
ncbi:MAG: hypothetical protein H0V63_10120 [Burkholderiaceae bacterium]|nr:hypothetical protein [Burkholderiaceae bacterium]